MPFLVEAPALVVVITEVETPQAALPFELDPGDVDHAAVRRDTTRAAGTHHAVAGRAWFHPGRDVAIPRSPRERTHYAAQVHFVRLRGITKSKPGGHRRTRFGARQASVHGAQSSSSRQPTTRPPANSTR